MTDTAPATATRESLRAQLNTTRDAYQQLLGALSAEDMKKKSANPQWTVGQLMWHLAWGQDHVPGAVERARKGKNFAVPQGPFNMINPWITRIGARRASPESLKDRYDKSHAKIMAALDNIADSDCDKAAMFMGEKQSVADHFQMPVHHWQEHEGDILKGLGRGA